MAIAALFQQRYPEAEELWEEAMELNPKHYDTKVNYELYRWKHAKITD
jgi:hypothetical protein